MIYLPKSSLAAVRQINLRIWPDQSADADNSSLVMARDTRQNVKWVEGVRGVASFLVVLTHLTRAFDYPLFWPRDNEQGRIGVMMFAFLTGYVCALKPLRQIKSGNTPGALKTLAQSAFRRPPRLIMPATIALLLGWSATQMNAFAIATVCDSEWLRMSSPTRIGGLDVEVPRLFYEFQKAWIHGMPAYDEHQWALLPLLKGAFLVYATLLATCFMKFRARVFTVFVLWAWYWCNDQPKTETFECMFLFGILLCDIGSENDFRDWVNSRPQLRRLTQTLLITIGLYVGSFPEGNVGWSSWSATLDTLNPYLFPAGTDPTKRWSSIAWHCIAIGFWLSPGLQSMFSNRLFMWLGRNSFAVYLTHGLLLRVVLVRFIYGWTGASFSVEHADSNEPIYHWVGRSQSWFIWFIAIPLWYGILYTVAHMWTTYVDAWCARATKSLEDAMFESEESEKRIGAQLV